MMSHTSEIAGGSAREAYQQGRFEDAFRLWETEAKAEDAEAQCWLGSLYANGEGVPVDDERALQWYLAAAAQGSHMAQANVGAFYYMGRGAARDLATAVRWLAAAAEGKDLNGLFNLAVLYSQGEGVPQDEEKALALYRQAAERGHYPSQSRLGYAYAQGKGVGKDRVQAFLWLSLAAQHGIGTALDALEGVTREMSKEEKASGVGLFEEWRRRTGADNGPIALYPVPAT